MKLGMIMGCEPKSFDEAKALGLDFVEFDLNHPAYWGVRLDDFLPKAPEIKAASERTGIEVGAVGRWGSQVVTPDGEIIEEEISEMKKCIDFAKAVGAPNFLVSVNYAKNISYYKNITVAIKILNTVNDYGKENGVTVNIVNCMMGDNYIRTPEQWKLVLDEVPGLKIKSDPSHSFVHGGDKGAYMNEGLMWGDRFGYVHIKGVIQTGESEEAKAWERHNLIKKYPETAEFFDNTGFVHQNYDNPPAGLDAINWRAFFGILYKYGYDGYLSIEPHSPSWTGEKGDRGVEYTIKYIRSLMI
ncbi:MAG: sugar phosphate isomerase/epimerase [Clostridia bacterium]|nr:sugar phosphate isomerase/epimerase [Clostridia bacterium]